MNWTQVEDAQKKFQEQLNEEKRLVENYSKKELAEMIIKANDREESLNQTLARAYDMLAANNRERRELKKIIKELEDEPSVASKVAQRTNSLTKNNL